MTTNLSTGKYRSSRGRSVNRTGNQALSGAFTGDIAMKHATRKIAITLAESMIAMTVLLIIVVAVCTAISSGGMQMYESLNAQRAISLAEELAESVLALPYNDPNGPSNPGPEPGETDVSKFDNADDFHGYKESPGQLKDAAGDLYPSEYQVFSREVTAEYTSQTISGLGTLPGLNVTVTVKDKKGRTWTLRRFMPESAHTAN